MPYVGVSNGEAWIIAGSVDSNQYNDEEVNNLLLMIDAQL